MKRTQTLGDVPLYALVVAIVLSTLAGLDRCGGPAPALSQERVSDQLALARVGASECGLASCTPDELAAIAAVLRARCPECRLATIARQYSARVFDRARRDGRAWVAHLEPDGREPSFWPREVLVRGELRSHAPWGAYRQRWLDLYELAGRVVEGEVAAQCEADHWGCPEGTFGCEDHERALRAGWQLVDCGETRNEFWRIPRGEDS